MKIKAIITGAMGMVGEGVLHECLKTPRCEICELPVPVEGHGKEIISPIVYSNKVRFILTIPI